MGVALTGDTSDQCFYVLHGLGANGKTTLVETVAAMLGDYAVDTPTDTLLSRTRTGSVPNDLARLKGARFVYAAEPDVSKGLAEELLKRITGGEPITARFLFREFFTCWPEFKLFLLANHMPQIAARDYATWRRVRLVPFTETIPEAERDKHFRETRLMPELAGILNWALDGLEMTQGTGWSLRPRSTRPPRPTETKPTSSRTSLPIASRPLPAPTFPRPSSMRATNGGWPPRRRRLGSSSIGW